MTKNIYLKIKILILIFLLISQQACSILKASPSKKNLFLTQPEKVIELPDRAPFNGVSYLDPEKIDLMHQTIKKIAILPVRVDLLEKEMDREIEDPELRAQRKEEAEEIGRYFTDRLKRIKRKWQTP